MKFSRRRSPFNHLTVMYKKSAVLNCGGYPDILRKEDIDLFVRMLHSGCISMNIPEPLLLFRSNKDCYKRRKTWIIARVIFQLFTDFGKWYIQIYLT